VKSRTTRPYESPTRKEHAELTRRAIIEALIALLVDEHPATISIPAVAKRANVSVRTVYHHFPTKEALFDELLDTTNRPEYRPELNEATTPKELAQTIPDAYRYLERNADLFHAVRVSEVGSRIKGVLDQRNIDRIEKALQPLKTDLDDEAFRRLCAIVGAIASSDTYRNLTVRYGLDRDDAAAVTTWAVTTLTDRARRTKRVGEQP
jgi:AcrR family transcriptional regulator